MLLKLRSVNYTSARTITAHVLVVDGEVVHVVQRSHAVGHVVHSHAVVLQVDNHANGLSDGEVLYAMTALIL